MLLVLATLVSTAAVWTATSAGLSLSITPGGSNGSVVTSLTSIGSTFSIDKGSAQKISGVELYKIQLGSAQFSNLIRINLALLNPDDMGRVLNNPNSF
ncbi:MAG: hypothetical protein Q7R57_02545, partial [Dehalococcoidales bacterium]|nr:hypothetical protein [Dehalococcoidales bacterium]